jgi:hypothetical protein
MPASTGPMGYGRFERGDNAEIAAASAQAPEQVGFRSALAVRK